MILNAQFGIQSLNKRNEKKEDNFVSIWNYVDWVSNINADWLFYFGIKNMTYFDSIISCKHEIFRDGCVDYCWGRDMIVPSFWVFQQFVELMQNKINSIELYKQQ